jgi:hypothetical protein
MAARSPPDPTPPHRPRRDLSGAEPLSKSVWQMSLARKLVRPIMLINGVTLRSLGDARDLILAMKLGRQEHWREVFELVLKAAHGRRDRT